MGRSKLEDIRNPLHNMNNQNRDLREFHSVEDIPKVVILS